MTLDDLILTLTIGGAYMVASVVVSIVAVKLVLDWRDRRG